MHLGRKSLLLALVVTVFVPARLTFADDLKQVLDKLDAAAKNFHTTSANFEFDTVQTDPVPDTDVMSGVIYYQRSGDQFQMAAHVHQHNSRPAATTYIFSHGVLRQSDTGKASDTHTIDRASKYQSYLMLGFGASGSDLAAKWDIKYLGPEKVDGVSTDKLELAAKDPTIRKSIPKITLWMDTAHGVSLKQVFDEGEGQSRTSHYTNIKVNQSLPGDAFNFSQ